MRVLVQVLFPAFLTLSLAAQSQQNVTYSTDINGRRQVEGVYSSTTSGNATTRTELTQSVNGRLVPWESVEERVLRDDEGGRVVERVIRRYGQDGRPAPPEKQQVEERKNADGSVSSTVTVYQGDINGRFQVSERVVTDAAKTGDTVNSTITVQRPTVNGSFEVVEKRQRTQDENTVQVITLRPDPQGHLRESAKSVTEAKQDNGARLENTAQYEIGYDGRMILHSQTVSRVRKNPDGTESREVDLYRRLPGRADPTASPALEERQVIEQSRSGDQLTETTYVQRPSVNDPKKLSEPRKLLERVCSGANCK